MKIRCPHCHNAIEIVGDNPLTDVDCPSCGSHFSLIGMQETVTRDGAAKTIAHFTLLDQIGVGQSGVVWKARDTKLDRLVAVKIPRRTDLGSGEVEQFLREARAAAQVRHPNIVQVHEIGRDGATIYIVSEFIEGVSLKEWMSAKRLNANAAAELCKKIAESLHHAHESGVIHRDLKPGNILMDSTGEPFIADFGLARREAGEITMTVDGRILGTPAYMSPEQAQGRAHQADRRSDVYSLGVILFELLAGELPFRGEMRMIIQQIIYDDPPAPRMLRSTVPVKLETICLKCLEKDPNRRYCTARDLADDLGRFLGGDPIVARPPGTLERFRRLTRRDPAAATLPYLWAFCLLLCLLTLVGWWALLIGERNFIAEQFRQHVNKQANNIERQFTGIALAVHSVLGLPMTLQDLGYISFQDVSRREFQLTAEHLLRPQHSTISTLQWAPRVNSHELAAWTVAVRQRGYGDFRITERDPGGTIVSAGSRDEYFPVLLVYPDESIHSLIGLDLAADPVVHEALDRARDSGEIVISQVIKLVDDPKQRIRYLENRMGCLAVGAVYRQQTRSITVADRRRNLLGFLVCTVDIPSMVQDVLADVNTQGMEFWITEVGERDVEPDVMLYGPPTRPTPATLTPADIYECVTIRTPYRRHRWAIHAVPTNSYVAARRTLLPWVVLFVGFWFVAILLIVGKVLTRRSRTVTSTASTRYSTST